MYLGVSARFRQKRKVGIAKKEMVKTGPGCHVGSRGYLVARF
jgi:hypothetical protein